MNGRDNTMRATLQHASLRTMSSMRLTPLSGYECQVCAMEALHEFDVFPSLPRVTSDAIPWPGGGRLTVCTACGTGQKVADAQWLGEIKEIYRNYAIYQQAGGAEQAIFSDGEKGPLPRSVLLLEHIERRLELNERAAVLDFGCGSGSAIRTFASRHKLWRLYGSELNDSALRQLREVDNFVKLYTGNVSEIDNEFDLITLIHSLEHVVSPGNVLSELSRLTGVNGHVFVEVPNCLATPYDLVVADHLTHFSIETLCFLCARVGLETISVSDSILPKEISWIGRRANSADVPPPTIFLDGAIDCVTKQLTWLRQQIDSAVSIAQESPRFGIFGTSISATWLAGALRDKLDFFVDEDPARVGRTHLGLPIFPPGSVAKESDVYVPLIPNIARQVSARLSRSGGRYHVPPDIQP